MLSHIWMKVMVASLKSYSSSSTFVQIDLLFPELLPFVQNSVSHQFSVLFLAMLSHICIKVGSKFLYEELQIKFDFCHGWPTFWWIIASCPLWKLAASNTLIMLVYLYHWNYFTQGTCISENWRVISTPVLWCVDIQALYGYFILQICCGSSRVCCPGLWHVWLCVSHKNWGKDLILIG